MCIPARRSTSMDSTMTGRPCRVVIIMIISLRAEVLKTQHFQEKCGGAIKNIFRKKTGGYIRLHWIWHCLQIEMINIQDIRETKNCSKFFILLARKNAWSKISDICYVWECKVNIYTSMHSHHKITSCYIEFNIDYS